MVLILKVLVYHCKYCKGELYTASMLITLLEQGSGNFTANLTKATYK